LLVAGAGPMPMIRGGTPATAMPSTRRLRREAVLLRRRSLASSSAAAPSLTPEALPAVTEPSGLTTPLSLPSASTVVSRGCSSSLTTVSPFLPAIVSGAISPA